jgi:hypothetical protein
VHRLALFGLLVAACGSRHPRIVSSPNLEATCLRSRGCPKAPPPPPCAADVTPLALADVLAHRQSYDGQTIVVRGPLNVRDGMCTELGCSPGGCCNQCGTALQLGRDERGLGSGERRVATSLQLFGAPACRGDESLVCCAVDAHGQDSVARGVLRSGDPWHMKPVELCTP